MRPHGDSRRSPFACSAASSISIQSQPTKARHMSESIEVLIVDDSRLFRAAIEDALRGQPDISVVGSVFNGTKALEFIRQRPPRVVTLDVEMPGMDGLATLEQIELLNAARPAKERIGVIMVSAFTRRGADVTVRALQAG